MSFFDAPIAAHEFPLMGDLRCARRGRNISHCALIAFGRAIRGIKARALGAKSFFASIGAAVGIAYEDFDDCR